MSPGEQPYRVREVAESFGADAAGYDRARPAYPDALVERVLGACAGRAVLAVGSGTGTDARQFAAAGAAVLGVEPDPRMAAYARARGTETDEAAFETWDPAGRTFDAVVAGTSWHWVDPTVAVPKAAAILRPGGVLALYGHVFSAPAPIARAYDDAYRAVAPESPLVRRTSGSAVAAYQAMYDAFAERVRESALFADPVPWRLDWERSYTRDGWLGLLRTTGGLTSLPPARAGEVLDLVAEAIADAGFTATHTTVMITAQK